MTTLIPLDVVGEVTVIAADAVVTLRSDTYRWRRRGDGRRWQPYDLAWLQRGDDDVMRLHITGVRPRVSGAVREVRARRGPDADERQLVPLSVAEEDLLAP